MNFGEKLKTLRKLKSISQEELAEKIHVSRQAITKWECGNGLPDIENLIAISTLFNETLDSLLSEEKSLLSKHEFLYESKTEYDLDSHKHIDFNVGFAHEVVLEKTDSEKILIMLSSNKIANIEQCAKIKIKETKNRMDVYIKSGADFTDTIARDDLFVFIRIPDKLVADAEILSYTQNLKVRDIVFDDFEFHGKLDNLFCTNASGHLELDTNSDIKCEIRQFKGKIDFNQVKAVSKICFAETTNFYLKNIGLKTRFLNKDGVVISGKREKKDPDTQTDLIIELAGWKSEIQLED